jgi:hypothetical protein
MLLSPPGVLGSDDQWLPEPVQDGLAQSGKVRHISWRTPSCLPLVEAIGAAS